jgi:hypothetical protein
MTSSQRRDFYRSRQIAGQGPQGAVQNWTAMYTYATSISIQHQECTVIVHMRPVSLRLISGIGAVGVV